MQKRFEPQKQPKRYGRHVIPSCDLIFDPQQIFYENTHDISRTLVEILAMSGIHRCKATAARYIMLDAFSYYDEQRHGLCNKSLSVERVSKDSVMKSLGSKCMMTNAEALFTYSVMKLFLKAFFESVPKCGIRNYLMEAQRIIDHQSLWDHLARRIVELYHEYEHFLIPIVKDYSHEIKFTIEEIFKRMKDRVDKIEIPKSANNIIPTQDDNKKSVKKSASSTSFILIPKSSCVCTTNDIPKVSFSSLENRNITDSSKHTPDNTEYPFGNFPHCLKCHCPKLLCTCHIDPVTGKLNLNFSQGPFKVEWYYTEKEYRAKGNCHVCPIDCWDMRSTLSDFGEEPTTRPVHVLDDESICEMEESSSSLVYVSDSTVTAIIADEESSSGEIEPKMEGQEYICHEPIVNWEPVMLKDKVNPELQKYPIVEKEDKVIKSAHKPKPPKKNTPVKRKPCKKQQRKKMLSNRSSKIDVLTEDDQRFGRRPLKGRRTADKPKEIYCGGDDETDSDMDGKTKTRLDRSSRRESDRGSQKDRESHPDAIGKKEGDLEISNEKEYTSDKKESDRDSSSEIETDPKNIGKKTSGGQSISGKERELGEDDKKESDRDRSREKDRGRQTIGRKERQRDNKASGRDRVSKKENTLDRSGRQESTRESSREKETSGDRRNKKERTPKIRSEIESDYDRVGKKESGRYKIGKKESNSSEETEIHGYKSQKKLLFDDRKYEKESDRKGSDKEGDRNESGKKEIDRDRKDKKESDRVRKDKKEAIPDRSRESGSETEIEIDPTRSDKKVSGRDWSGKKDRVRDRSDKKYSDRDSNMRGKIETETESRDQEQSYRDEGSELETESKSIGDRESVRDMSGKKENDRYKKTGPYQKDRKDGDLDIRAIETDHETSNEKERDRDRTGTNAIAPEKSRKKESGRDRSDKKESDRDSRSEKYSDHDASSERLHKKRDRDEDELSEAKGSGIEKSDMESESDKKGTHKESTKKEKDKHKLEPTTSQPMEFTIEKGDENRKDIKPFDQKTTEENITDYNMIENDYMGDLEISEITLYENENEPRLGKKKRKTRAEKPSSMESDEPYPYRFEAYEEDYLEHDRLRKSYRKSTKPLQISDSSSRAVAPLESKPKPVTKKKIKKKKKKKLPCCKFVCKGKHKLKTAKRPHIKKPRKIKWECVIFIPRNRIVEAPNIC